MTSLIGSSYLCLFIIHMAKILINKFMARLTSIIYVFV